MIEITKNKSLKEVKSYVKNVGEGKEFITQTGNKIINIYELYDIVYQMSDDEFQHHVNENKNDFKNWILHVIKDKSFADKIAGMKTKEEILAVVEKSLNHYKEVLEKKKSRMPGRRKAEPHVTLFNFNKNPNKAAKKQTGKMHAEKVDVPVPKVQSSESPKEFFRNISKEVPLVYSDLDMDEIQRQKRLEFLFGLILGIVVGIMASRFLF